MLKRPIAEDKRIDLRQRARELLEKARHGTITCEEGLNLLKLLERLKKQHEDAGDYFKAMLTGMMILFTIGTLFNMFGEKFASEWVKRNEWKKRYG